MLTSHRSACGAILAFLLGSSAISCAHRRTQTVATGDRATTETVIKRFVEARLEPARIPPPSLSRYRLRQQIDGVEATVQIVRAEEQSWNSWPGRGFRLFNNRAAHLFLVRIEGPDLRWIPGRTSLELNREGNALEPAPSHELLLEDLLFWAYHQQRWVLEGDLAARARGAGPFRAAYLPLEARDGVLEGVVAFPIEVTEDNQVYLGDYAPGDYHVVAMRLTLAVASAQGERELTFLFE